MRTFFGSIQNVCRCAVSMLCDFFILLLSNFLGKARREVENLLKVYTSTWKELTPALLKSGNFYAINNALNIYYI